MNVRTFVVGMLETNCYLACSMRTLDAVVIDPGFESQPEASQIFNYIRIAHLKVRFIVNTHGHSDHISGNVILKERYGVPVCIHGEDAAELAKYGDGTFAADVMLKEGDKVQFGDVVLRVMDTPGHTPGSICLLGEDLIFTGDTLFTKGIGRTDLVGGSYRAMRLSLEKVLLLPDGLIVYPGHGPSTTVGEERRANPFLRLL